MPATNLADELIGKVSFSDAPNGLFLAGDDADRAPLLSSIASDLTARGVVVLRIDLVEGGTDLLPVVRAMLPASDRRPDRPTIADLLLGALETAGQPICLIVDHADRLDDTSRFALKSSRDQINRPGEPRLMLVLAGSDPDAMSLLLRSASAPFFGSRVRRGTEPPPAPAQTHARGPTEPTDHLRSGS